MWDQPIPHLIMYYEHWLKDLMMYFWLSASMLALPTSFKLPFLKLNTIIVSPSMFYLHVNVVRWLSYYPHYSTNLAPELIMSYVYISRCLNWSEVVFKKKVIAIQTTTNSLCLLPRTHLFPLKSMLLSVSLVSSTMFWLSESNFQPSEQA